MKLLFTIFTIFGYLIYKVSNMFEHKTESFSDYLHNHLAVIINNTFATTGGIIGVFMPTTDEFHSMYIVAILTLIKVVVGGFLGSFVGYVFNTYILPFLDKFKSKDDNGKSEK